MDKVFEGGDHAINSKKVDVKRAKAKPGKMFLGGLKVKPIKKSAVCLQFFNDFFFLQPELSEEEIKKHFEQYGTIIEFEMPFDKTKNQRKGFGFITFEREETMKELIKKGKDKIGEHEIDLKKATPKSDPYFGAGYSDFYGYDYYGGYGGPYDSYYGGFGSWGGNWGYGG